MSSIITGPLRQAVRTCVLSAGFSSSSTGVSRTAASILPARNASFLQGNSISQRAYSRTTVWRDDSQKNNVPEEEQQKEGQSESGKKADQVTDGQKMSASEQEIANYLDSEMNAAENTPKIPTDKASDKASDEVSEPSSQTSSSTELQTSQQITSELAATPFPPEIALIAPELQEIFPLIPLSDRQTLLSTAREHFQTLSATAQSNLQDEASKLRFRLVNRFGTAAANPETVLEPSPQSVALMNTYLAHLRPERPRGLFALDEADADVIGSDEPFQNDDISPLAHAELERQREIREYARWTVWELPLLSKYSKEFKPPTKSQILRFKYTRVLGEAHPSDRKVVLEFCVSDLASASALPLQSQRDKLIKLVGPRYNPDTDIVRMSCDSYATAAQNKRRLAVLVQRLLAEARGEVKGPDGKVDDFEDLPMDFRHHKDGKKKRKGRMEFPAEWVMTPERRRELDEARKGKEQAPVVW